LLRRHERVQNVSQVMGRHSSGEEVNGMAQYRRRRGKDTWHWCSNCQNYPASDYESSDTKPKSGELCNECQAKDKAGTCQ
jgi:hypothetical protein